MSNIPTELGGYESELRVLICMDIKDGDYCGQWFYVNEKDFTRDMKIFCPCCGSSVDVKPVNFPKPIRGECVFK